MGQQSVRQGGDAPITVGGSFLDDAQIAERIRFFRTGDIINLNHHLIANYPQLVSGRMHTF
jgi:hypothetical protein